MCALARPSYCAYFLHKIGFAQVAVSVSLPSLSLSLFRSKGQTHTNGHSISFFPQRLTNIKVLRRICRFGVSRASTLKSNFTVRYLAKIPRWPARRAAATAHWVEGVEASSGAAANKLS